MISIAGPDGDTPLHKCIRLKREELAKLLLNAGADPNRQDVRGCTSLHLGLSFGSLALIGLLVQRGASVSIPNSDGNLPLHLAALYGRHQVNKRGLFVLDCFVYVFFFFFFFFISL